MEKSHRIALTALSFFCVTIIPLNFFIFSSVFEQINAYYLSTSFFKWLSLSVNPQMATSALKRFFSLLWTMLCLIFWTTCIDHDSLPKTITGQSLHKKIKQFFIGFFVQAFIIALALCIAVSIGSTTACWSCPDAWTVAQYFVFSVGIIGCNVVAEELIFRGYLLQKFSLLSTKNVACFLSAVLFALAHPFHTLGLYGIITQAGLIGFALAYIALYYNSIYVTIGMHLANNVLTRAIHSGQLGIMLSQGKTSSSSFTTIYQLMYLSFFLLFFIYHQLGWKMKTKSLNS